MVIMSLVVVVIVARATERHIDSALKDKVSATASALQPTKDGSVRLAHRGHDAFIDSVWVFDRHGTEISGPDAGTDVQAFVRRMGHVTAPIRRDQHQRAYYATPVRLDGDARPAAVAVAAMDLDPYNDSRDRLVTGLLALSLAMTLLTAAFTAWTVRRTLRPVAQMTLLADHWSEHDLDTRFRLTGSDELTRLGNTLDLLLDRVTAAIRREQQLTSELAHELRTPLTTIRAEAELGLLNGHDPAVRERLERIVAQVDRLTGTMKALLEVTRHDRHQGHGSDPESVLDGLIESHSEPVPITLHLEQTASGVRAAAEANLLERVVAPVLDNAVHYAATGVWIDVRRDGRTIVIEVGDDGPGIDAALEPFEPGTAGSGGTGLGLPLARRLATGLGGSIRVAHHRSPTLIRITVPIR